MSRTRAAPISARAASAAQFRASLARRALGPGGVADELFGPILRNHPESLEGKPSIKFAAHAERAGKGMIVEIVLPGYLDDAISGEQFLGLVQRGASGWALRSLWKRNLCARGRFARR